MPSISVIVPVYNCENYIEETLLSALTQDLPAQDIELIVVDDGSTDSTPRIVEKLAAAHQNLRSFSMENSGSAGAPRNLALDHARGEWVFFLDADDQIEPDTLRRLRERAEASGSEIVLCRGGNMGDTIRPLPVMVFRKERIAEDFVESFAYRTLASWKLIRRSLIERLGLRFPTNYAIGEDQPFNMSLYLNTPHISALSDKVYYWVRNREDGTNVTARRQPADEEFAKVRGLIEAIVQYCEPGPRRDLLLERPVVDGGGFRSVFGAKFIGTVTPERRRDLFEQGHALLKGVWNERLRASGTLESVILCELIVAGGFTALEEAAQSLHDFRQLEVRYCSESDSLSYKPSQGESVTMLLPQLECSISSLSVIAAKTVVTVDARAGWIVDQPSTVTLVWRHRKTGQEHVVPCTVVNTSEEFSSGATYTSKTTHTALDESGDWDAYIRASWGLSIVEQRLGVTEESDLDTTTRVVPSKAGVYFTPYRNLSIQAKPRTKYSHNARMVSPAVLHVERGLRRDRVVVAGMPEGAAQVFAIVSDRRVPVTGVSVDASTFYAEVPRKTTELLVEGSHGEVLLKRALP
ncbi:glycosyltransferase family 2 protein [Jonesia quinghaiensis]|uniref:glycosyltransferase family 2 protein n=1 Tax=Jonesia quinghaiensis TaxID=262806 RepID=UPI0004137DA1|nr:glycosyltransferase family 2 protein [Jonesia quinghaiensis]